MVMLLNFVLIILLIHLNLNKKNPGETGNDCTKNVEIIVTLKNLNKFWRTLGISLITKLILC